MQHPKHDTSQVQFQLARFTSFSDGVFAISITLLIIEIKVPVLTEHTDRALWQYLSETALKLLGFIISFGIVAHFWSVHHRIFGYAKNYTTTLLWINLAFLFSVVLLPFSSGLLGEYSSDTKMNLPYAIYVFNMCLTGFINWWLWRYISNPKHNLLTRKISSGRIKLGLYRSLVVPVIFILSLIVSFFLPIISRFIPVLIPIILHWVVVAQIMLDKEIYKYSRDVEDLTAMEMVYLAEKTFLKGLIVMFIGMFVTLSNVIAIILVLTAITIYFKPILHN